MCYFAPGVAVIVAPRNADILKMSENEFVYSG